VNGISLNETRTGFLQTLVDMGVDIETLLKTKLGEPIGDVIVRAKNLIGVEVPKSRIPAMIDEIPVLAVLATQARGTTLITGAEELRVKESDRIEAVAGNLRAMGAKVKTLPDGLEITGPQKLKGARIKTFHDHRIAMAFSIAALVAEGETTIEDSEVVGVSYPDFFHHLKILSQSSSGTT
jgi:3-phosphoshikimate 1-carboxyvinyltransferase